VVEEADSRRDLRLAVAVERNSNFDVGFLRLALDLGGTHAATFPVPNSSAFYQAVAEGATIAVAPAATA
jgi:hypothetical protein